MVTLTHIILTHEQADFDALASLLGAFLLEDGATPLLPRRMNRNVRAYLTLYGTDLPFIEARDLPAGRPVDDVTLVDTQSMVSVKGVSESTRVHVIDHHPLRDDLPPNWRFTVAGTGANTTLFVEWLRDREISLSLAQSTLLLLGIYEDTGSLTYDRTTARDLRAASHLLELGASLQMASGFLNHPLSKDQRELYDRLRGSLQTFQVHGYTILVASGDAGEMEEELSTIAHKLRDLMDPDALCVLVTTRGGVQIILRSTSENINVAEIAAHFGGGGHERAAAALVRDRPLAEVQAELLGLLPGVVRPAMTVAQIMSSGPQLVTPETSVGEAAQRMQRYGYEGYPVVKDGRVLGLLTRRAVDRAISHKMNVTAEAVMDAGGHSVHPEDSLEHLQRVMTETGWGQIPVVDPSSGRIIGIVTRTDLLKTLTPEPRLGGRSNLERQLERALPPKRLSLLQTAAAEAHRLKAALYIVGGFVRDLLMERPSLDFDLVVEGDAIALARALAARHGGRVTSHSRFGTAKWYLDQAQPDNDDPGPQFLDLVSARTEFYTYPSALPTVERGSIKLDLHRRDFTINTLALRLDGRHWGELHDHWGGLNDINRGLVRVLHSLSFVDDPTRMLRAVRFEQRFDFRIETRTLELLEGAVPLLDRVSGDRIRHELDHILDEPKAGRMLARLDELGLLRAIHPELVWDEWFRQRLERATSEAPEPAWDLGDELGKVGGRRALLYTLWLVRLPPEAARKAAGRLKFSAGLVRTIQAARRIWEQQQALASAGPSAAVDLLDSQPALALYAVWLASDLPEACSALLQYQTTWRHITPTVNGHSLRRMGISPGPVYKDILKSVRDAWLDGRITTAEQEAELLGTLLAPETRSREAKSQDSKTNS